MKKEFKELIEKQFKKELKNNEIAEVILYDVFTYESYNKSFIFDVHFMLGDVKSYLLKSDNTLEEYEYPLSKKAMIRLRYYDTYLDEIMEDDRDKLRYPFLAYLYMSNELAEKEGRWPVDIYNRDFMDKNLKIKSLKEAKAVFNHILKTEEGNSFSVRFCESDHFRYDFLKMAVEYCLSNNENMMYYDWEKFTELKKFIYKFGELDNFQNIYIGYTFDYLINHEDLIEETRPLLFKALQNRVFCTVAVKKRLSNSHFMLDEIIKIFKNLHKNVDNDSVKDLLDAICKNRKMKD